MNIISRIFCYPMLERQFDERGTEIERLRAELKDWQNKWLNREGFSPLGTEEEERTRGGDVAASSSFDFTPLVAKAHRQWDEDEAKEREGILPPLGTEEQAEILEEAQQLT